MWFLDSNLPDDAEDTSNAKDTKDELSDILGSHFDLESIPNINSKDVEDIFKVRRNLQKIFLVLNLNAFRVF